MAKTADELNNEGIRNLFGHLQLLVIRLGAENTVMKQKLKELEEEVSTLRPKDK